MNTIFWNVDTQKDFMLPNGKLYIKDAEKIIPSLKKITDIAKEENIKVINTCDWHLESDLEISTTPDFKSTFPAHCVIGTEGADFIDEVYPKTKEDNYYLVRLRDDKIDESTFSKARNIIIEKDKFDVFEGNKLTNTVIDLLQPETVVLYGVALDVCVKFALLGLVKRKINVILLMDCTKELPNMDMDAFIKDLEPYSDYIKARTIDEVMYG